MQFKIITRYQGVILDDRSKIEVGLGNCSVEDKCLNLHDKWYLKENMVGTTIAKRPDPRYEMNLYQGNN